MDGAVGGMPKRIGDQFNFCIAFKELRGKCLPYDVETTARFC